ncbi:hypothetical protein D3C75_560130 [compost metagenome]
MDIFRTNAHDHIFTDITFAAQQCCFAAWNFNIKVLSAETDRTVHLGQSTIDKVHCRGTDKSGYEQVCRLIVQLFRRSSLLNDTIIHNYDTVTHCHSFCLVMRYVDTSGFKAFNQFSDFSAHLTTKFSIQVGKRLIHQEDLWITYDSASQSYTLALTTGKCFWFTIKQMLDIENSSSFTYFLVDFIFLHFTKFQTESHVLVYAHMRIQGVGLEYHRDIAVFRCNVVDYTIANVHFTFGDFFQTSDHTQGSGFTTTGRSNQYEEFLIFNIKIDVDYCCFIGTRVFFENML